MPTASCTNYDQSFRRFYTRLLYFLSLSFIINVPTKLLQPSCIFRSRSRSALTQNCHLRCSGLQDIGKSRLTILPSSFVVHCCPFFFISKFICCRQVCYQTYVQGSRQVRHVCREPRFVLLTCCVVKIKTTGLQSVLPFVVLSEPFLSLSLRWCALPSPRTTHLSPRCWRTIPDVRPSNPTTL